jgi:hypothetical protein
MQEFIAGKRLLHQIMPDACRLFQCCPALRHNAPVQGVAVVAPAVMGSVGTQRLRAGKRRKVNHQHIGAAGIGYGQGGLSRRRGDRAVSIIGQGQ